MTGAATLTGSGLAITSAAPTERALDVTIAGDTLRAAQTFSVVHRPAAPQAAPDEVAGTLSWDSVRFPPENGEDAVSLAASANGESGLLYLPNSNNLFKTTVANDTYFMATAGAIFGVCTLESLIWDGINRQPHLFGSTFWAAAQSTRSLLIRYTTLSASAASPTRGRFVLGMNNETGETTSGVLVESADPAGFGWPAGSGRLLWAARLSGGNFVFDLWDCTSGAKLAGTPVAAASFGGTGWVGLKRLTKELSIGGVQQDRFPLMASNNSQQTINAWRGEAGFVAMSDTNPSDADFAAMALGADPLARVGAGNFRLYCPLTANGALALGVTSNKAAVVAALAQRGTLYPGSTLRPQSQTQFLTVDKLPDPCLIGVPRGASSAPLPLTFRHAGVAGAIEARVQDEDGSIVGTDWRLVSTATGAETAAVLTLPWHPSDKFYRLTFRISDGAGGYVYARVNTDVVVAFVGAHIGQSEMVRGFDYNNNVTGTAGLSASEAWGAATGRREFRVSWSSSLNKALVFRARYCPPLAGAGVIRIANDLRADTGKPLVFVNAAVSGTSGFAWLDDAQTSRKWSDFELALSALGGRDGTGAAVISGAVLMWEAFFNNLTPGNQPWCAQFLRPLVTGVESVTASGAANSFIAQADIDHYLYDGLTLNPGFDTVVLPANRANNNPVKSTTDIQVMADRRKDMRDNCVAVSSNVKLGPETGVHACESIGVDANTHPDTTRETGIGPWCRSLAVGYKIAFGLTTYTARRFTFTRTAPNKIVATISSGTLDTEGNFNAAKYSASPVSPIGLTVTGFECDDGTGATSWAGFTATIIAAGQIELVKTSGNWPASANVRFGSGGPGDYIGNSGSGNTAAEDAWIKAVPLADGLQIAGDNTIYAVAS